MLLSIVIPSNGRSLLRTAVASCLAQEGLAGTEFEIVVVDNTAAGRVRDTLAGFADERLRRVHAPEPGVAEARNRGVEAARGRYVAFLDDDEEASPRWACALLAHARGGAAVVFGPIEPRFETPPAACPQAARRMYSRDLGLADGSDVTSWHAYLGTGNSLFDKAACLSGGKPFATELNGLGGEDSALLMALAARGVRFTWAADAWVKEHVPSDRLTLDSLATRHFRNGQVRSFVRFRAGGLRKLEGVAWMGVGLVQAVAFASAGALLTRLRPQRAAAYRLKACSGAGKMLWMPRFWRITYGAAGAPPTASAAPAPAIADRDVL